MTLARDQIVACAAMATAGYVTANGHFPIANPAGVRGTGDPLPLFLFKHFRQKRQPFADGTSGALAGEAEVVLYAPASVSAADLETLADTCIQQLYAQQTGLMWGELTRGDASNPSNEEEAGDTASTVANYRTISLFLVWGINV